MEYGLDGASWQGFPDWRELSRYHSFMLWKVTGEGQYENPTWRTNHDAAKLNGVIPGTYDWVEPQWWESAEQGEPAALEYIFAVGKRNAYNLMAVDFETPQWANGPMGRNIEPFMRRYLYTLKEKTRKQILVYAGPYFLRETGAENWDWLGRDFLFWIAAPGEGMLPDNYQWPATYRPFRTIAIHQHQWHATSPAVIGEFDRNRTQLTKAQLSAIAGGEDNEVIEPSPGKYTAYINADGNTVFVWNMGGQTDQILGVDVVDIGMTVASKTEADKQISASIKNNTVLPYLESRRNRQ